MSEDNKPKSTNWVRIVLIGSLALNFVLAGLMIGAAFKVSNSGPRGGAIAQLGGPMLAEFPPELRQKMRREVFSRRGDFNAIRDMVAASDIRVQEALQAVPFDVDLFREALDNRRDALGKALDAVNEPIVEIVSGISDEDRAMLAQAMEERRERITAKRLDKDEN